jgi:hypothetical protein
VELTEPTTIVALAAGVLAIIALTTCLTLGVRLRRLRADQKAVLGDKAPRDLVTHAAQLEAEFDALHRHLSQAVANLNARLEEAERRLDLALSNHALVRYDAYGELSGKQSTSIALLDSEQSGVVVSSIVHRDQARVYAKRVTGGQPEIDFSPEEAEAVRLAMAREQVDTAPSE